MFGLVMLKEYIDEILSGSKTYDARAYDTRKRGRIALVDTRKSQIVGTVELVGTHRISAREYEDWHKTGKWEHAEFAADPSGTYYAYDFRNPVRFEMPIRIEKNGRTWCSFEETVIDKRIEQQKLF